MLEDIFDFRKCRLLVDELGSLQVRQEWLQSMFGVADHLLNEAQGEFFAKHRQGLQQFFLWRRESIDTGGEDALHGGWEVQVCRSRACPAWGRGRVANGRARPKLCPYSRIL